MPFSLRLDPDTEALIRQLSVDTGRSRSAVVREAVAQYFASRESDARAATSAYDRLKPFVGVVNTGGANLSTGTHEKYREQLLRKHRRAKRPR
jgi:predicted DNA-binding protein